MSRLPPAMAEALELAEDAGQLFRFRGGYWADRFAPQDPDGVPQRYARAKAVMALIARGRLTVVERIPGSSDPRIVEPR